MILNIQTKKPRICSGRTQHAKLVTWPQFNDVFHLPKTRCKANTQKRPRGKMTQVQTWNRGQLEVQVNNPKTSEDTFEIWSFRPYSYTGWAECDHIPLTVCIQMCPWPHLRLVLRRCWWIPPCVLDCGLAHWPTTVHALAALCVRCSGQQHQGPTRDCPLSFPLHPLHHRLQLPDRVLPSSEVFWWLCCRWMYQQGWGGWLQGCGGQLCHMVWAEPLAAQHSKDQRAGGGSEDNQDTSDPGFHNVDIVEHYKYLGLFINNKLDWTKKTEILYKKGQSCFYFYLYLICIWNKNNLIRRD